MANENPRKIAQVVRWLGPILDALRELGGSGTAKQVEEIIARNSGVTEAERTTLLKSGQTRFYNQINWAKLYLRYEGLIVCPKSGIWQLTETGERTDLTIDEAERIAKRWHKHTREQRKQRASDQPQDDAAIDESEIETEGQPQKRAAFLRWMGPILDALRELGGVGRPKQVEDIVARNNDITDAERQERIKTGQLKFSNQVAWGKQYLIYEGLLVCPKRGDWTLTDRGQQTQLSIDDAAAIAKKWVKHHKELRNQRIGDHHESDAAVDPVDSELPALDDTDSINVTLQKVEYDLAACARDTNYTVEALARWVKAIERKQQAVLYGPPGTGKTFVAEHLARHLADEDGGFYEVLQFHPAYSYEDFVQGIRPTTRADGYLEYAVMPGRFIDFCERAKRCRGRCVLIVDEINRANLSRVFGELMYLLEYRDREIPLAAGGRFRIPPNVRILGTMNTADRSIALVDHALRRRFAFLALHPDFEILRQFHLTTGFDPTALIELLRRVNRQIGDRHYEVGISYFLRSDIRDQLEDIWRMEIEPYLEEVFFDQEARLEELRWDRVSGSLAS